VFRLKYRALAAKHTVYRPHPESTIHLMEALEIPMKTYRLITFVAAALITVLIARVFTDEKIGASAGQPSATAMEAP